MQGVLELGKQLNEKIKDSEVYKTYISSKEKLTEHTDLLRGYNEFRRRNYEIQNNPELDNPFDEIRALSLEYDDLMHDTIVNDFIRAESEMCLMMRQVYEELAKDLDFDIG